jgi:hypothetical protein
MRSPEMGMGAPKTPENPKFSEKKIVNGIKIKVRWDEGYDDYTVYFPQIMLGEEAEKKGVSDQVIRLTHKEKIAKQVFDYAIKLAETETDVYEIYKQVKEHAHALIHEDEEQKEEQEDEE